MKEEGQILDWYNLNSLKSIASARSVPNKGSRAVILDALTKVLWDPKEVEQILPTLSPAQHTTLQRAKHYGGRRLRPDHLQSQLEADGIADAQKVINSLLRLGFFVYEARGSTQWDIWPNGTTNGYYYYYQPPLLRLAPVVAERVTIPADLGRLPLVPWTEPLPTVQESTFSTLQRDLYQFLQYLRENRVKLLKSGLLSKRDFTRINQSLSEPDDLTHVATFDETFRLFFLDLLLQYAGLRYESGGMLLPTAAADDFFQKSEPEQARLLLQAWLRSVEWNEFALIPWIVKVDYETYGATDIPTHDRLPQARQDILALLDRERPVGQWITLPSLIASMERYKIGFLIPNRQSQRSGYRFGGAKEEDDEPLYAGFRRRDGQYHERFSKKLHWALVEGGFIATVLQWSLRWLGIVRLGSDTEKIVAFQVTDLGAAALGWTDASAWAPAATTRALIVQPNFEIIAMLESAGLGLLAELDRFAERLKLDKAALYRLTRESVCRGLQAGMTREQIEETLRERSGMPLPQNVEFTLREWEELFNRIRIRKRVLLLEADTESELEKRLADLGQPHAHRVSATSALIDAPAARKLVQWGKGPGRRVALYNYAEPTASTFKFVDAREIEVRSTGRSPLLEHRLARLAVPMKNGRFLLDPERTRTAVSALGLDAVIRFLEEGSNSSLLPDTRLTLEGWAGKFPRLGMGKLVALAAPRAEVLDTISRVPELAKHLRRLTPTVALVPQKEASTLQKALAARGVSLSEDGDLDQILSRGTEADEVSLFFVRPKRRREIIDEAIMLRRRLMIGWQNYNSTRLLIHEVDPIRVVEGTGNGTLVGYSQREKYQMQFAIGSIQGIRMLETPIDEKVVK
jgi:Helicase conserved C-terminal domain